MKYDLRNVNLEIFKPRNIELEIVKTKNSRFYKRSFSDIELEKATFDIVYEKFINDIELRARELKILCLDIAYINKNDMFEKFYKLLDDKIKVIKTFRGFIRPLLSYIYNYYDYNIYSSDVHQGVYKLLKKIINNVKNSDKTAYLLKLIATTKIASFLNLIRNEVSLLKDINEIKKYSEKISLKETDSFYLDIIIDNIIKNNYIDKFWDDYKNYAENMNLYQRTKLFKGILNYWHNYDDISKYPENWFYLIGEYLGEPYDSKNIKWSQYNNDEKDTFRIWFNSTNIYKFFSEIADDNDNRRMMFWKNYVREIYRIRFIKDTQRALIMEFSDHVIIEFGMINNALYIYDKESYDMDYIDKKIKRNGESMEILKNTTYVRKKLNHRGAWEYSFTNYMNGLGYNKGEW